ncbi:unnamed protein product [Trichogramma brassicae]|uniref:Uncharacterized protein n=1 Tax=Trichogramma brassicae TaxID=86971 RepID=A0A6H5J4S8_9HYME|nr:unnamed protein product [Trichogramma brassicae]
MTFLMQNILKNDCPNIILVYLEHTLEKPLRARTDFQSQGTHVTRTENKSSSAGSIRACLCGLSSLARCTLIRFDCTRCILRRLAARARVTSPPARRV